MLSEYDIIIPTKKCPLPYEIVYEYNNGYSDKYQGLYILTILYNNNILIGYILEIQVH